MKKTLSLVLAAVLAMGSTATAFAVNHPVDGLLIPGAAPVFTNSATGAVLLGENSDGHITGVAPGGRFSNAESAYIEINTDGDMKAADIKKFKIKGEWSVGKDLIEKVSIVYKKDVRLSPTYGYFAEIKFKSGLTVSKSDLEGEVTLFKSSAKLPTVGLGVDSALTGTIFVGINKVGEADVKFVDTVPGSGQTNNHTVYGSSTAAAAAGEVFAKVVAFDKNKMEEATIIFDGVGEFNINVHAQDKLYLGFDRKVKNDVIAKYSYANLEFINFPGEPMFNKTGIMNLYAETLKNDESVEDSFVYSVNADGVIAPVKSTWNEELSSHKFAVRKFAPTYIISDVELELGETEVAPINPIAPEVPVKQNPNTGR